MKNTTIAIVILTSLVLSLCIWDMIFVGKSLKHMEDQSKEVYASLMQTEIDFETLTEKLTDIEDFWNKTESTLCLIIHRSNMHDIGQSLQYLIASATLENLPECILYSRQLVSSVETLNNYTKLKMQNILGVKPKKLHGHENFVF